MSGKKSFDASKIKQTKPINPLIFQTAADMSAVWFEAALSSGLPRGKYVGRGDKPIKMFVADHLEKFIPIAISTLIEMLKPTANTNAAMKEMIHAALTDPLNDPELMLIVKNKTAVEHKNETEQMVLNAIRNFDKNKIGNISTQSVIHNPIKETIDLKGSTGLKHG